MSSSFWGETKRRFEPGLPHPDSPGEQALYRRRGELPGVAFNVWAVSGYADLAHTAYRIAVEIDGYWFHDGAGKERAADDRRRDRERAAAGWQTLRFTSDEATAETARVIIEINEAVARRAAAAASESEAARMRRQLRQVEQDSSPRTRVFHMIRQLGNYVQQRDGAAAARAFVVGIQADLKREFGPADSRTDKQWEEALAEVDDFVVAYRAKHGISARDLPSATAKSCPRCRKFHGEGECEVRCPVCEEEFAGEPLVCESDGREYCLDCYETEVVFHCGCCDRTDATPAMADDEWSESKEFGLICCDCRHEPGWFS